MNFTILVIIGFVLNWFYVLPTLSIVIESPPDSVRDLQHFQRPQDYDVVITDFKETDLFGGELSRLLACDHLKEVNETLSFPVKGKIFGSQMRLWVCLPVQLFDDNKPKQVIFLVDTGATGVYLSQTTMNAVGQYEMVFAEGKLNGLDAEFLKNKNDSHFYELNLLGGQYFKDNGLSLLADYTNNIVTIDKSVKMDKKLPKKDF